MKRSAPPSPHRGLATSNVDPLPAILLDGVHQAADPIVITDRSGTIRYVNQAFEKVTGFAAAEVLGRTPRVLKSGLQDQRFYRRLWRTLLAGDVFRGVLINRRKSGELYYEDKIITPVLDEHGHAQYFLSVGREVTERMHLLERMEHLAYHDILTDLPNRLLFMDRLRQAIVRAHRRGSRLAVLFIDLDGFKAVNDRLGHETGDHLLRGIAARFRKALRESDTVARLGGDEFAVLLDDIDAWSDAAEAAEKLSLAVQTMRAGGRGAGITASIGVSAYPADGTTAGTLLRRADEMMYRAKRRGKNRIECALPGLPACCQALRIHPVHGKRVSRGASALHTNHHRA